MVRILPCNLTGLIGTNQVLKLCALTLSLMICKHFFHTLSQLFSIISFQRFLVRYIILEDGIRSKPCKRGDTCFAIPSFSYFIHESKQKISLCNDQKIFETKKKKIFFYSLDFLKKFTVEKTETKYNFILFC